MATSPSETDKAALAEVTMTYDDDDDDSKSQNSQDLRGDGEDLRAQKFNANSRSVEKVMDTTRRKRWILENVGTDDPSDDVTPEYAEIVKKSVLLTRWKCLNRVVADYIPYIGQTVLIRRPSDGSEVFVTCKHNVATFENKQGELETCVSPHELYLADNSLLCFRFPETGWQKSLQDAIQLRNGVTWSNGYDITTAKTDFAEMFPDDAARQWHLEHAKEAGKFQSVDMVDQEQFQYTQGLKIGIFAYVGSDDFKEEEDAFTPQAMSSINVGNEATYAIKTKGVKKAKMQAVLGSRDDIMIYHGTLTFAGDKHIEYNINTYKGCSGAVVVVLERTHPDFGKAIAIHAGYSHGLETNIGFKLTKVFGDS